VTYERPLGYEIHDLTITVGDDVTDIPHGYFVEASR
jgi:hypothetical protein